MKLAFGFTFSQLYDHAGLSALDARFVQYLAQADAPLHNRLVQARLVPEAEQSALLIAVAPHVEDFVAALFGIEKELRALQAQHHALAPLHACKRLFVQRRAAKGNWRIEELENGGKAWDELEFSRAVMTWLENETAHKAELEAAERYAAWALYSEEGKNRHKNGVLFKLPHRLDAHHLVPVETELRDGITVQRLPESRRRPRRGFALTDSGGTPAMALDQANYCILCHHQDKDSCSKGLHEKDGAFKNSALGVQLAGCPLEEKISEMHELKQNGIPIGALAMVCVDNPMCAGTGHRICNDCMKSCIFQKQEPVNTPLAETRVLADVLALPYGFEVYSLLSRWNPLNLERPIPKAATGKKVLVVGTGPAGYTLSHHLLNDGHTVVAVDGVKIEPLPERIAGINPIRDIAALYESLDGRIMAGFGGVAEYGITVRWDKNYLKIIRLLLERRAAFLLCGGVRFGGQLTHDGAFALGFDHIALCAGAGKPTVLDIPNGLSRGVRAASDFLMGLQLTGAARADSIANLQLRLPVVVIGGGLTAIDTATEALAYYPVQVEKFLARYEALVAAHGESAVRKKWSEEEKAIADEFISHAKSLRKANDPWPLLDRWGGVKILYRKRLIDAPSYRLNHEEVEKAFEEGMFFAENFEPQAVEVDKYGHVQAIKLRTTGNQQPATISLPARSILVAAGTSPNTVLAREDPAHFQLDGRWFRAVDEDGHAVTPERNPKPAEPRVLLSADGVSFFGDVHPSFAGNVVKAMASAKRGYPVISRLLEKKSSESRVQSSEFLRHMRKQLTATVHAVNRLTPNIVEIIIHAPLAAAAFQPGQFYRLQNYEAYALAARNPKPATTLLMEPLAMTGASVDRARGLISLIVLEMGGSSDLCAHLKPGEPVVLMGPTGSPTEIPPNTNVLLAGGGLGNAVLFSIGAAFRQRGGRVLYFAAYRTLEDRYKIPDIENAADVVVWCCEEALIKPNRPQDMSFRGNIVDAMLAYAGGLGIGDWGLGKEKSSIPQFLSSPIPLSSIDRLIAIGSDRMMQAVTAARHGVLKPHLKPGHTAIGSINSPMQCMMKEICAQCLQQHKNPLTGEITYVYSCFNQDQPLDAVSFPHLADRLGQNTVQEKLTAQWVDHCLKGLCLRPQAASGA